MNITMMIPGAPRKVAGRPARVGPGQQRKVGLTGSGPASIGFAPWLDPSWEFWVHGSSILSIPHLRAERVFDLHPPNVFKVERKNGFVNYYDFIKRLPTPIYMLDRYEEIPQSIRYPLELVRQQWPGVPLGSTTSYMIALALLEGVTHLGLWGLDYQSSTEYDEQRANAEMWVGIAMGSGVQVVISAASPLCHEPKLLYGYESHTPDLYAARIEKKRQLNKHIHTGDATFSHTKLQKIECQADLDAAAKKRAAFNPAFARAMAEMTAEPEPAWLPKNIGVPVCDEPPVSSPLPSVSAPPRGPRRKSKQHGHRRHGPLPSRLPAACGRRVLRP
jgi:hypothetical protein